MRPLLLALPLLVLGTAACAQSPDCGQAKTQMDATACSGDQFNAADRALNAVYGRLRGKLDEKGRGYLQDAQRAWIEFRDRECVSRTGGGPDQGGTIWPMVWNACRTDLTRQRVKDLEAQVKCPGGDLSCPG